MSSSWLCLSPQKRPGLQAGRIKAKPAHQLNSKTGKSTRAWPAGSRQPVWPHVDGRACVARSWPRESSHREFLAWQWPCFDQGPDVESASPTLLPPLRPDKAITARTAAGQDRVPVRHVATSCHMTKTSPPATLYLFSGRVVPDYRGGCRERAGTGSVCLLDGATAIAKPTASPRKRKPTCETQVRIT